VTRRVLLMVVAVVVIAATAAIVMTLPVAAPVRDLFRRGATPAGTPESGTAPTARVPAAAGTGTTLRGDVLIDARRQQLTGVRTEAVRLEQFGAAIRATGAVRYDETRQAEVSTRISGWIRDLYADYTGRAVRAGEPLFTLYSPELLTTESEYLLAHRAHGRAAQSELDDVRSYSERLLSAARQRLLLWEVSADHIHELERRGEATGIVTVRSPATGVLVDKAAVKGMRVMAGQMLFRIADLASVWIEADIYERDLGSIRVGQRATVTFDAYPGESFAGRASYIYPSVNETTRAARVRFAMTNRDGRLHPGMFANLEVEAPRSEGLTVAANAVLDSGKEQIVFVAEGAGMFTPRTVRVGRRQAGEQVAVGAAFFLDSESQLRAGLQNYAPAAAPGVPTPPASALDISFRATPDPPKTGDATFEVTLKDATGAPVTEAQVSVRLFMPAMPTMNMPAMQNETTLAHVGGGVYRGPGQVMMAGRWDVTVVVSKSGQALGQKQFAIVAR
jgi:RND family efflux transporter MFP subunit